MAKPPPARTVLDRIDALSKRTGLKISPWYVTLSGKWEVTSPHGGTSLWDNGRRMIDELERTFPE